MQNFEPNPPRPGADGAHRESSPSERPDALSGALEELIARRESGVDASPGRVELSGNGPAQCPEPGEWLRLASGEAADADADVLLAHAAFCGKCAQRLRIALSVSAGEVSAADAALDSEEIAGLKCLSPDWQSSLAAKLARTPHQPARKPQAGVFQWTAVALAASLLVAAAAFVWWRHNAEPDRLLANVYGHSRIFVLRMPGAAHAAVTPEVHLRGGATGREPADLLNARASIESHLDRNPQDAHWLQLQARSEVFEENFDPAIDILDRLLAAGPVTAALLTDDAAAYYQRGVATGSETDRATALDYLSRADELAPGDPVVLFNEAIVMEDRGQVMNAVETWNRYLRFEQDADWLAEGRSRLADLEKKLEKLKTHQSRMDGHLATPAAMRALAADTASLAAVDEEFSSTMLPGILYAAFPLPTDRSRGSPCADACQAARELLHALAASLEQNHQDRWLTAFLPSDTSPPPESFSKAAFALGKSLELDSLGDFASAIRFGLEAAQLFHSSGNVAGEDRVNAELAYAYQRLFKFKLCREAAQPLLGRRTEFAWVQIAAFNQEGICDTGPGTASQEIPAFTTSLRLSQEHHYLLQELRARNMTAGPAMESGDSEEVWHIDIATLRRSYGEDIPPFRVHSTVAELGAIESTTPRIHLTRLIKRESLSLLELSRSPYLIPEVRAEFADVAIRAGNITEAEEQAHRAQSEMAVLGGDTPVRGYLAEYQVNMANFYLGRRELKAAAALLDSAKSNTAGDDDFIHHRQYAVARGQLELALGHPGAAADLLKDAILDEERQGTNVGAGNVLIAEQDRDMYAVLAGVWLAQKRPAEDVLALWERYRLRILGEPVPACGDRRLDCLRPQLSAALKQMGRNRLCGQIVLPDRILSYGAGEDGVAWTSTAIASQDVLNAAAALERAASSPETSMDMVHESAKRVGDALFADATNLPESADMLLLEPDPLLGNLPWPAVEIAGQPIGLRLSVEETPSLLLPARARAARRDSGGPLIVGASVAAEAGPPLPEALNEAREVARFARDANLLLAADATEPHVASAIRSADAIHFAGHAMRHWGETRLMLAAGTSTDGPYLDNQLLRKHAPLAARLVVFSACSTGKREAGWNHDMGDIVNTLADLGVPEVVATRWQIDSSSAVPMMDAFYGGLARGLTVPQSLTLARQSLNRDLRYRHPYYWAAYYASGKGTTDLSEVFHDGGTN